MLTRSELIGSNLYKVFKMVELKTVSLDEMNEKTNQFGTWLYLTILLGYIQTALLNPDMCNLDFRLNRTDWNVPVPPFTYNLYVHNRDFA